MSGSKLRKDARTLVSLVARYRSPTTFEFVEEECYDLSSGGMFVKSNKPVAAGTLLKLECDVGDGQGKIRGVARVVWLRHEANEHGPIGMGVKFVKLEGGSRKLIEALVSRMRDAGEVAPTMSIAPEARTSVRPVETTASVAPRAPAQTPVPSVAAKPDSQRPAAKQSMAPAAKVDSHRPAAKHSVAPAAKADSKRPPAIEMVTAHAVALDPRREPDAERVSDVRALTAVPLPSEAPPTEVKSAAAPDAASASVTVEPSVSAAAEPSTATAASEPSAPSAPSEASAPSQPSEPKAAPAELARAEIVDGVGTTTSTRTASRPPPASTGPKPLDPIPAMRSVPPPPGWWKPWVYTTAAIGVFFAIASSDWFLGDDASNANDALGEMEAPAETKLGLSPPEHEVASAAAASAAAASAQAASAATAPSEPAAPPPMLVAPEPTPEPVAAAAAEPAAKPEPAAAPAPAKPEPAAVSGMEYVVEVVTVPPGATVHVGDQVFSSPARARLGAFTERVRVAADKTGHQSTAIWLDRTGFVEADGVLLRRMYLVLKATSAAVSGSASSKPAPAAAATPTAAAAPAPPRPAEPPPSAAPAAAAAPVPVPPPPKPARAGSPLDVATQCLAQGDNACVIETLDGRAKSPRELELLIETLRAVGRSREAQKHMATYVEKFPDERRTSSYRRTLQLQADKPAAEGAPAPAASP